MKYTRRFTLIIFAAVALLASVAAWAGTHGSTLAATPNLDVGAAAALGHHWPILLGWGLGLLLGWGLGLVIWAYQRFNGEVLVSHNVAEVIGHLIAGLTPASVVLTHGGSWAAATMTLLISVFPSFLAWRASPRDVVRPNGGGPLPIDPKLRDSPVQPPPSTPGTKREAAIAEARRRFEFARLVRAARRTTPLLSSVLAVVLLGGCATLNQPWAGPPGCDPTNPSSCPDMQARLRSGELIAIGPSLVKFALAPACQHDDDQQRTWGGVEIGGAAGAAIGSAVAGFGQINQDAKAAKTAAVLGAVISAVAGGVVGLGHYEQSSWLERWGLDGCPARPTAK